MAIFYILLALLIIIVAIKMYVVSKRPDLG